MHAHVHVEVDVYVSPGYTSTQTYLWFPVRDDGIAGDARPKCVESIDLDPVTWWGKRDGGGWIRGGGAGR